MPRDARLEHLRKSLDIRPYSGTVTSLCIRKDNGVRQHPEQIEIDVKKGVKGDRWIWRTWKHLANGDPDPRVQVAVCNSRILGLLQAEKNNPYHPGDNLMVDCDLDSSVFPPGQRFKVGEAVLEVSDVFNDACAKFAGEFGKDVVKWINLPEHRSLNLRGIFCRTIQGGKVTLGDALTR